MVGTQGMLSMLCGDALGCWPFWADSWIILEWIAPEEETLKGIGMLAQCGRGQCLFIQVPDS